MIPAPAVDGRRVESFFQELKRYAPHYTPDLNLSDEQGVGVALMRIFAQLAEIVSVRLDQAPQKHFVAFLDHLGISLLPARSARAAVTFKLAAGLQETVKVPLGTRVTAPGIDDDIPFETTGELNAIPGVLTAAYGVDPVTDKIFGPPPDFLKQESRQPSELSYKTQSLVAAGSNRLQLDDNTELGPGSFVLIGCAEKRIVQKKEEGGFVTLFEAVTQAFPADTRVVPIRNFEVFDGIDVQEHVLYIGHASLLTVKEEVEIKLVIKLQGELQGFGPRDLVWEFWTKDESVTPEQAEHWEELTVKSDRTNGLASSGEIVLVKKAGFEIKPREVGGNQSRWIRARLVKKLPFGTKGLPQIETINVGVSTGVDLTKSTPAPKSILADQGFYNATPLDLQVDEAIGFFPFGTEPRQFDQFYIASKEAFSKRRAKVGLDFKLDLQTLAGPSVVAAGTAGVQELRLYSIGLRRSLFELNLTSGSFINLGGPFDTPITGRPQGSRYFPVEDSVPAVITNATKDSIFAFVRTEDAQDEDPLNRAGKVWLHFHLSSSTGNNPRWLDLDAPPTPEKKTLLFNPAAVPVPSGWPPFVFARVFAVGGDKKLYSRDISNAGSPVADWQPYTGTFEPACKSSPFVTVEGSTIFVFVTGEDGVVHRLTVPNGGAFSWTPLIATTPFTAISRPFAQMIPGGPNAKVFVIGTPVNLTQRKLFECDTSVFPNYSWLDLEKPPTAEIAALGDVAPAGFLEDPANSNADLEGKHIFLRSAENELWERLDGEIAPGQPRWENRTRLGDPGLRDSPAVYIEPTATGTAIKVFAASGRNSLVSWEFEIHRGPTVPNPNRRAVLLDQTKASTQDGAYDGLTFDTLPTIGMGETSSVDVYDGVLQLVRLQTALTALPGTAATDDISIDQAGNDFRVGPSRLETSHLLVLHNPVLGRSNALVRSLRLNGIFIDPTHLEFYSRLTGVVSLTLPLPPPFGTFSVYDELVITKTEFLSADDTSSVPELSWEYFNGRGWLSLVVIDGTRNLLSDGVVTIPTLPKDIESTEVAGQENYWIRARLVGGDYGRETFKLTGTPPNQTVVPEKSSLRPPKVRTLRISYEAKPVAPEACLTFNNLNFIDQTAACQTAGSHFRPFETPEDPSLTIFFGFDKTFKTGPVRLLLDAAERDYDESKPPEFEWSFRKDRIWKKLDADDDSVAITRQGILTLSAAEELTRETRFGQPLFWIKGSLRTDRGLAEIGTENGAPDQPSSVTNEPAKVPCKCSCSCGCAEGTKSNADSGAGTQEQAAASAAVVAATGEYPLPLLRGVFLNTVWATQGETITEEIVGSGDGEQNQSHNFQNGDVLEGEDVRIREVLSAEERERIERDFGKESVTDREDLGGTWVRWNAVKALFDCGPQDRCFEIDRATGSLRFGDGAHGSIPPAGVDNIRAFSYRTGGGALGNVASNKIQSLATAVAGIESVFNPAPSGGGSDKADTNTMLTVGPRRLSHLDRAVSVEDFEELAYEASRQVAKVRCLATTNLKLSGIGRPDPCDPGQLHEAFKERGRVSLIIVPDSQDPRPCPSVALRRAVKSYLLDRAPSAVASGGRIVVRPPDYVTVDIKADLFVTTLERASAAETEARNKLNEFLHPVKGGPEGLGWDFGRPVSKSDVFALLERITDIDRVENLVFKFRGQTNSDRVEIGPNELLASGEHTLAIRKA